MNISLSSRSKSDTNFSIGSLFLIVDACRDGRWNSHEISGILSDLVDFRECQFDPFAALALRQSVFKEND
jgi:hypothetical protein